MKIKLFSLFLAVTALFALFVLPTSAADTEKYFIDGANVVHSASQANEIEQALKEISEKYDCPVMIVTATGISNYSYEDYAIKQANKYEKVILFMQFTDIRAYQFEIRYAGADAKNRERAIKRFKNTVVDYLADNDNVGAYTDFVKQSDAVLEAFAAGKTVREPYPVLRNIIITIVVAILVGFFYVQSLMKKLKSVDYRKNASSYVKNGSMNVKISKDIYLYSTVTRTARPKNTSSGSRSSGGSRGSRGSGGGGHY